MWNLINSAVIFAFTFVVLTTADTTHFFGKKTHGQSRQTEDRHDKTCMYFRTKIWKMHFETTFIYYSSYFKHTLLIIVCFFYINNSNFSKLNFHLFYRICTLRENLIWFFGMKQISFYIVSKKWFTVKVFIPPFHPNVQYIAVFISISLWWKLIICSLWLLRLKAGRELVWNSCFKAEIKTSISSLNHTVVLFLTNLWKIICIRLLVCNVLDVAGWRIPQKLTFRPLYLTKPKLAPNYHDHWISLLDNQS